MNESEVALIVGGGPGISTSCARLFSQQGVKVAVAVAARDVNKPALKALAEDHGVTLIACDASVPESVAAMFEEVSRTLGTRGSLCTTSMAARERCFASRSPRSTPQRC